MHFSRTFPKAVLLLAFVLLIFISSTATASAAWPWQASFWDPCGGTIGNFVCDKLAEPAKDIVRGFAGVISATILFIAGLFFWIANLLIDVALDKNQDLALGKELIVNTGHSIVLSIANMGFIVALIVIAFATMLRSESFGYKRALPRVVIAALLVNFGFFIVTHWLIAPVNQIVEAFRSASHFDPASSFAVFKDAVGVSSEVEKQIHGGGFAGEVGKSIASVLFTAAFSLLAVMALFAFAGMLLIRYVALGILIILLPLAWVTWIFPNLKIPGGHPWTIWWDNFTRWLLFAPFAMFFFYLALSLAGIEGFIPSASDDFKGYLGGIVLITGLLLGGLIAANKLGVSGGAMALGAVAAGKVWAQAKFKSAAINLGHRALLGSLEDEKALKPWTNKALALGKNAKGWKGVLARPAGAPIRNLMRRAVQSTDVLEEARKATAIAKVKAGAPYRQEAMLAGLSEFEQYAAAEDMLTKGYAWETKAFWRLITAAGLDPGKMKRIGMRRFEILLNDAGLNIEAVAAVKPLEDFEMPIRDRIEKQMKGRPKEEIEQAIQDEFDKPENAAEIQRLQAGVEWNKRAKMKDMINILKTSEIPKMEKRLWSAHKGYYGNRSKLSHEAYSSNLRGIISEDRPQGMSGARNNSRGDGVLNWDITAEQGLQREDGYLVRARMLIDGVAETDAAGISRIETKVKEMDSKAKLKIIETNPLEVATAVKNMQKEAAIRLIGDAIDVKTGMALSSEDKAKLIEAERKRIDSMTDVDVARLTASRIQNLYKVRRGGLLISSLIAEEAS